MEEEAIIEATGALLSILKEARGLMSTQDGMTKLSSRPGLLFGQAMKIYSTLMTNLNRHSMFEIDDLLKKNYALESAAENFWNTDHTIWECVKEIWFHSIKNWVGSLLGAM